MEHQMVLVKASSLYPIYDIYGAKIEEPDNAYMFLSNVHNLIQNEINIIIEQAKIVMEANKTYKEVKSAIDTANDNLVFRRLENLCKEKRKLRDQFEKTRMYYKEKYELLLKDKQLDQVKN